MFSCGSLHGCPGWQRVFFDDGKIAGVIRNVRGDKSDCRLEIKITHAAKGTAKLRAEKGINLPDTRLSISAMTPKDREDLQFASRYGDLVSLSFVRRPEDVAELIEELDRLETTKLGIIIKIENRPAIEALPQILLMATLVSARGHGSPRRPGSGDWFREDD
jgi:pyruvate kinase